LFDLENIRSFFRARLFENKKEIFNQVYIPYGTIKQSLFLDNLETEQEFLARNFSNTAYPSIIDKGSRYLAERHSFLRLERLCEEERLKFLSLTRRMTFGIEPLFGYYHFKLNEIKNLRQVYSGKVNEIPVDDLKESIPDVF
jgi:vacuolar-type H+-ATPase subunit C/Vma6